MSEIRHTIVADAYRVTLVKVFGHTKLGGCEDLENAVKCLKTLSKREVPIT